MINEVFSQPHRLYLIKILNGSTGKKRIKTIKLIADARYDTLLLLT